MKMKTDNYVELCNDLADSWLQDCFKGQIFIEHKNGDIGFTDKAQIRYIDILNDIESILESYGIVKE